MGCRIGLTLERRQMAVGMLTGGMRVRVVRRHFVAHERTIARLKKASTIRQEPLKTVHVLAGHRKPPLRTTVRVREETNC